MLGKIKLFNSPLTELGSSKMLISTLNAHSFNTLKTDNDFREALQASHTLLPDGISVVLAMRLLRGERLRKIAGADLFHYEMQRVQGVGGKCFFLGSSEQTLQLIIERAAKEYPEVEVFSYSPPFKAEFSIEESRSMIEAVNAVEPDVLFIGMTAPKQEKWAYEHFRQLNVGHVCCIGAVFDFYAGTVRRAPGWMISIGMEWLYRLLSEPKRMWRRYLIGNAKFVVSVLKEKFFRTSRELSVPNRKAPEIYQNRYWN